ncbi:hypothetical protein DVH24_037407 [Malus domestica]|uniref:Uncharacterized protein n=1 Tax=Malus domestica TaxID=3750 RepID=A0A498HL13_MALDO|nr:hypothetical protein DVH24_037407 [Malus domestica]
MQIENIAWESLSSLRLSKLKSLFINNLTRWAGALLELSQFQNVLESKKMTQDAISKLEEALLINPRKHDALWCLGNAQTARAFSAPDQNEARVYFEKASQCFQKALNEEPGNDLYRKSFEVAAKGPQLYSDLRKHGLGQLGMEAAAGARAGTGPSASIGGKVIFPSHGSLFPIPLYAKSHAPPPPLPQ